MERKQTSRLSELLQEYRVLKTKLFGEDKFAVLPDNEETARYNQLLQFFKPQLRTKDYVSPHDNVSTI